MKHFTQGQIRELVLVLCDPGEKLISFRIVKKNIGDTHFSYHEGLCQKSLESQANGINQTTFIHRPT